MSQSLGIQYVQHVGESDLSFDHPPIFSPPPSPSSMTLCYIAPQAGMGGTTLVLWYRNLAELQI